MTDNHWTKPCPDCRETISKFDGDCPHCGEDVRPRCPQCGLPYAGQEPTCPGFHSDEERKAFFRSSPHSKRANRPQGGRQRGYLAVRRATIGY